MVHLSIKSSAVIILLVFSFSGCSMGLAGSARTYEKKGDYNMAVRYYEKAARSESQQMKRAAIYMQLSSLYARVGLFDIAQARLKDARIIISDLPEETIRQALPKTDFEYYLAIDALERGNYNRCISLLEPKLLASNAPDIHYYLSIAYKKQAEKYFRGKSIPAPRSLTAQSPEFREAINLINQGRRLCHASDGENFEKAGEKFKLALERVSENSSPQNDYEKALLLLKKKEHTKAIHLLNEMSETADVNYYLGLAHQEQAHISTQKAIQWLEEEEKEGIRENISALYEDALKAIRE